MVTERGIYAASTSARANSEKPGPLAFCELKRRERRAPLIFRERSAELVEAQSRCVFPCGKFPDARHGQTGFARRERNGGEIGGGLALPVQCMVQHQSAQMIGFSEYRFPQRQWHRDHE